MINTVIQGDCLEVMKDIPDKSVDMVLTDPPFGTTGCKWDAVIPFDLMWTELKRIIKPKKAILLFSSQPFTCVLGASNIESLRYSWSWDKKFAGNFVQAKRMPLKIVEDILVFCFDGVSPDYYPIMIKRDQPIKSGGNSQKEGKAIRMKEKDYVLNKTYDEKFPVTLLSFSSREGRGLHPTQKPVSLLEYLIKTYTAEDDTILDFTCGSGSTCIAAMNTNRKFIGIEKDAKYYEVAKKRIEGTLK